MLKPCGVNEYLQQALADHTISFTVSSWPPDQFQKPVLITMKDLFNSC